MTLPELTALIALIRDATEASTEIDGRLWCMLRGHRFIKVTEKGETWGQLEGSNRPNHLMYGGGWFAFENLNPDSRNARFQQMKADGHYAYGLNFASARGLIPDGYDYVLEHVNGGLTIGARVGHNDPARTFFGATDELALLGAALEAQLELKLHPEK